jgi:hypothetical protein
VWEAFNDDPIYGWMRELEPSVSLFDTAADVAVKERNYRDLPANLSDLFSRVNKKSGKADSNDQAEAKQSKSDDNLNLLKNIFAEMAASIDDNTRKED